MNKAEVLATMCDCGRHPVGGWYGDDESGSPMWMRVAAPVVSGMFAIVETHTRQACYGAPRRLRSRKQPSRG